MPVTHIIERRVYNDAQRDFAIAGDCKRDYLVSALTIRFGAGNSNSGSFAGASIERLVTLVGSKYTRMNTMADEVRAHSWL
jgi:hypothetical protein